MKNNLTQRLLAANVYLWLVLVSGLSTSSGQDLGKLFQDDSANYTPSKKEIENGQKLLNDYFENSRRVTRYACAMFIDKTMEDYETPQNTSHNQAWYFHARDVKPYRLRQDEIRYDPSGLVYTRNGPQIATTSDMPGTLFKTESEVIQVKDVLSNRSIKFEGSKPDEYEAFWPQAITVPWRFPIEGSGGVEVSQSAMSWFTGKDTVEVGLEKMRVASVKQVGRFTGAEYALQVGEVPLSYRILFDVAVGNMPVRVEKFMRYKEYTGRFSTIETDWVQHDGVWLPHEVFMEHKLGQPQKPVSQMTHLTEFYWVLNKSVSDDVFIMTPPNVMQVSDLKAGILEHAVNDR